MKKTIGIIGMGRFGLNLVESFSKNNVEILAIDSKKERAEKAGVYTDYVVVCDSTNAEALEEAGIKTCDHVIVAFGQVEDSKAATSIMTIIRLKNLGVKKITVRVDDESLIETMKLIGADEVVLPLKIASDKVANKISSDSVVDYFKLTENFDAYEIKLNDNFKSLPITELNARAKYLINILLIKRNNVNTLPTKESILQAGDNLIIFGKKQDINKITHFFDTFNWQQYNNIVIL